MRWPLVAQPAVPGGLGRAGNDLGGAVGPSGTGIASTDFPGADNRLAGKSGVGTGGRILARQDPRSLVGDDSAPPHPTYRGARITHRSPRAASTIRATSRAGSRNTSVLQTLTHRQPRRVSWCGQSRTASRTVLACA